MSDRRADYPEKHRCSAVRGCSPWSTSPPLGCRSGIRTSTSQRCSREASGYHMCTVVLIRVAPVTRMTLRNVTIIPCLSLKSPATISADHHLSTLHNLIFIIYYYIINYDSIITSCLTLLYNKCIQYYTLYTVYRIQYLEILYTLNSYR